MNKKDWTVELNSQVQKALHKMPLDIIQKFAVLVNDIKLQGPIRGNWPNYSKLTEGRHHCHIKKGKPTYVAVWEEKKDSIRVVEVIYVGTHEKATY